jgi:galactose-1-phosphate uridylyltransferase
MPKQPGAHFHEIMEDQLEHLAHVINLAFRRLDRIAGIPPYNAFIRTAPADAKSEDLPGFRWHIDIIPHLSIAGGLEIATNLDVITVNPEDAAHALRQDS